MRSTMIHYVAVVAATGSSAPRRSRPAVRDDVVIDRT